MYKPKWEVTFRASKKTAEYIKSLIENLYDVESTVCLVEESED